MSKTRLPAGYIKNPHLHAYLILSPDYTVRANVAREIAKSMLCDGKESDGHEPCGICSHCIKNDAHSHPDCIHVGKGAKTIVDNIRDIEEEAYLAPNEAQCKVFILDDCDEFNVSSQNALLKIIEEPPANVKFVFTAASAGGILPTVRSRVCTLTVDNRSSEELLQQIKKEKSTLSGNELESVCAFVQSFDKSDIKTLDEQQLLKYKLLAVEYFSGEDKQPVMKFPAKREELMLCLQVFMLVAGEICRAIKSVKSEICFLDTAQLSACACKTSLKKAHAVYDALEKGYILTEEYANINATISYLWQSIR
ncbi:MAG: hypothetical protein J6K12_02690 [Clostridia bacterium]|nr:hypothetical protein [Clostridia bacterium]